MIKSKIIRLFPTKEQEQKLWRHVGASRFIWNYMLALQIKRYEEGEKHLGAFGMNYLLTELKKTDELSWLYEVSNATLQRSCADLAGAYDGFFKKRSGFPKFKSRKRSKPCDYNAAINLMRYEIHEHGSQPRGVVTPLEPVECYTNSSSRWRTRAQ